MSITADIVIFAALVGLVWALTGIAATLLYVPPLPTTRRPWPSGVFKSERTNWFRDMLRSTGGY